MEIAVFGGGCFWCIQALFQRIKGVIKTQPGYCGGKIPFPTYRQVKTGETEHIEVVKVTFDSKILPFETLLLIFMNIHDPTQSDGQGEDIGSQYLSTIFYQSKEQQVSTNKFLSKLKQEYSEKGKKIATIVRKAEEFYVAEDYHKNYFNEKGNQNPYCNIIPGKITKMRKLFKDQTLEEA